MGCCGRVRGNPEMERQEPCFLVRCKKNGAQKTVSVPLSSPGRQDAAPRRCTFASGPPPPLPPVPSTRATPWDPRAARSFAFAHAACTRPGWGGTGDSHRSSAAGAAQRAPTSSSCSAPQKPTRRFPPRPVCEAPRTALFAAPPSGAAASPAASCAMHCTPLVQDLHRHAPHLRRRAHSSAAHALLPRGN